MRVIKSLIRSLVALPKQQYYDTKTNLHLDLSYITPRIIVSSAPVSSYLESWYRYPLDDLLVFLNSKHGNNWHLFNFRGEGPGYSYDEVGGKVSHYPFPDHYPPTMEIIISCVAEIDEFLQADSGNVAVLHCKAGKGRSGTLCCAYLIYYLKELNLEYILQMYTHQRMSVFAGDGISILSQKRYLSYWYDCVHNQEMQQTYLNWHHQYVMVDSIRIKDVNVNNAHNLDITISGYTKEGSNTVVKQLIKLDENNSQVSKEDSNWIVYKLNDQLLVSSEDIMIGIKSWCYLWFNVFFESNDISSQSQRASFVWQEFDGFKGMNQKGSQVFSEIQIHWLENFKNMQN